MKAADLKIGMRVTRKVGKLRKRAGEIVALKEAETNGGKKERAASVLWDDEREGSLNPFTQEMELAKPFTYFASELDKEMN